MELVGHSLYLAVRFFDTLVFIHFIMYNAAKSSARPYTCYQNVSLSVFMHDLQSCFRRMHNENTVPIRNVVVSSGEVFVMPHFHTSDNKF